MALPSVAPKRLLTPRSPSGTVRAQSRTAPPRTDDPHSSTATVRPALAAWSAFAQRIHAFARFCFVHESSPTILVGFASLERLFADFTRRADSILKNPPARPGQLPPFSIERSAEALVAEWRGFIANLLDCINIGVPPLSRFLSARLSYLASLLQGLVNAYARPNPLIAIRPILKAIAIINSLKYEALKLSDMANKEPLDFTSFQEQCIRLAERIHALFPTVFPNNSILLGAAVETKRNLLLECDKSVAACEGIRMFDEKSREMTEAVVTLEEVLQGLFQRLGLSKQISFKGIRAEEAEGEAPAKAPVSRVRRIS
jgi:hypothetical protein